MRWRRILGVGSVVTGALLLAACASTPVSSSRIVPSPAVASSSPADPVVVAIGDSIMKGHGLSPSLAWPALLAQRNDWKLTNLACNGAGFATVGDTDDCAATFSALVAKAAKLHPDIVLISGSSNDLGVANETLTTETATAMQSLRSENPGTRIVGISTVWSDTLTPPQIDDINDQVREAVQDVGGIYLDIGQPLAGHRDWLQADDVHPTAKGQQVLARTIAGALRSAGIIG